MKQARAYILPLLLLLGILFLFIRMQEHRETTHAKSARKKGAPIPVDVTRVARRYVDTTLPSECVALANPLVLVANPSPGQPVAAVEVRLGQAVRAGQIMLHIDAREQRATLAARAAQLSPLEALVFAHRRNLDYWTKLRSDGLGVERDVKQAATELAQAEVELSNVRGQLDQAKTALERTSVVAPANGIVLALAGVGESEYGRLIGSDESRAGSGSVAAVGVVDPILIECDLPEDKLVFVRAGQAIKAIFPSSPGQRFSGTLSQIRPSANPDNRTVTVVAELPNPQRKLLPGVHGLLQLQARSQALRIPAVALVNPRPDAAQVFVVDDESRARLRQIKIGGSGDGWIQVLEGLKEGESLVVVGQVALEEGDRVRIGRTLEPTPAPGAQ